MKTLNYFKNNLDYNQTALLYLICLFSRLITSIDYSEDIDSLRFALALIDYNILELRPHFPGYPVFCFFTKIVYSIINNIQYTFSIIGSLSIFLIIIYTKKIEQFFGNHNSLTTSILIFVNPLLWNFSNRYMSDLFGLSILMILTYYFFKFIKNKDKSSLFIFSFLLAILIGVRVSFLPFFLVPSFYLILKNSLKNNCQSLFIFTAGIAVWLIPLISITGYNDFVQIAIKHINGHFFRWGGSVITNDSDYFFRFLKIIESIWADGLGGWWVDRHWLTFAVGIQIILISILSLVKVVKLKLILDRNILLLISCLVIYWVWIFFFQNIIYKPRHVIPFIPFILIFLSIGINNLINRFKYGYSYSIGFILSVLLITSILNFQHKSFSAIAQIRDFVINSNYELKVFTSSSLINNFVKHHNGTDEIIFINKNSHEKIDEYYNLGYIIFSTQNLRNILKLPPDEYKSFYHNPYVNRLWPRLNLYIYSNFF